jgi:hypothetical protein
MIKKFEKTVAWAGLAFFSLCVLNTYLGLWSAAHSVPNSTCENGVFLVLLYIGSVVGLIPMLVGGLGSKPRYFWLASSIAGFAYLISLTLYAVTQQFSLNQSYDAVSLVTTIISLAFLSIPGLLSLGMGIRLKRAGQQENKSGSFDESVLQKSRG